MRCCLLVLVCFSSILSAGAHTPVLYSSSPNGFVRGSSPELHLYGKHLTKAKKLLFYHEGITAGNPVIHDAKHVSFPLIVSADCALGEHPIRLHCADGVTYQRTIWVTPFAVTKETEDANDSVENAQEISLNSCVRGLTKKEDVDFYKVRMKKGQRLSIELLAMRLGKSFFDAHLSVFDPSHRAIASSDDTALSKQDPYLSIIAQTDGFYYLAVREASYEGSDKSRYLLNVGDFLLPAAVFPPAAKPNEETSFTFVNGDGSQLRQKSSPSLGHIYAEDKTGHTGITANPIRLSPLNYLNEKEPNNSAKQTQASLDLPCAFHGIIDKPEEEEDWFKFTAKKNQDIRIQVFARSLGSPLDARISLRHPSGKHIAMNDDSNHPDSKLDHKTSEAGEYIVNIRDHLGKGGPSFTYRIEITERSPSISASLNRADRNDSQKYKVINIPRGSNLAYKLNISRDRNSSALLPHAEKLPQGVKLHAITASKGITNIPLYFSAKADAPLGAGLFPMTIRSDDGKLEAPITETIEHVFVNNKGVFHKFTSDRLSLCVTEKAPFNITLTTPTVPAVQSGNIQLEIKSTRSEGFDKDITLFFPWLPPGMSAPASVKLEKGKDRINYSLSINGDCKPQTWQLCVSATADSEHGKVHLSSNLISLQIKPPYLSAKLGMAATTQGQDTSVVCTIEHHTAFKGKAELTLQGLPDGITSAPVLISKESTEVLIPISVNADARTGKHNNLFCLIRISESSQLVPHIAGQGGSLRIDSPPKNAAKVSPADAKKQTPKKPLTRLEQLRLERKQNNQQPASN